MGTADSSKQFAKIKAAVASWLWAGMLTLGFAALAAGYYWKIEFLKSVGQTIAAAGVFAATLKYFQLMDMFRGAIVDLVNSDDVIRPLAKRLWSVESLAEITDIEKKWEEVTGLVNKGRFPKLSGKMNKVVKDVYLGRDHTWHYDSFETVVSIKWLKQVDGTVRVESTRRFYAIPSRQEEPVNLSYKFWPLGQEPEPKPGVAFPLLVEMTIDGEKVNPVPSTEKDGSVTFIVTKSLTGKERYHIVQKFMRDFVLNEDPYIYFATTRPMDGALVRVQFLNDGLSATFDSAGTTHDFEDEGDASPGYGRDLVRRFKGVIFPNQGFLLIFKLVGAT